MPILVQSKTITGDKLNRVVEINREVIFVYFDSDGLLSKKSLKFTVQEHRNKKKRFCSNDIFNNDIFEV